MKWYISPFYLCNFYFLEVQKLIFLYFIQLNYSLILGGWFFSENDLWLVNIALKIE